MLWVLKRTFSSWVRKYLQFYAENLFEFRILGDFDIILYDLIIDSMIGTMKICVNKSVIYRPGPEVIKLFYAQLN